jgi:GntR family transcriptional regulator, transcriptional repressor for pyruvate dehydrogenase complex
MDSQGRFAQPAGGSSEQIASELRHYILKQQLDPGTLLGTEQGLADEFAISRPTMREALRILAGTSMIRTSRGPNGGVFVASTPSEGIQRTLTDSIGAMINAGSVTFTELLDSRIHLEVPLAGMAALNAADGVPRQLAEAIAQAEGNDPSSEPFRLADARFHRIIADAAGNQLMTAFASWTIDVLQPTLIRRIGAALDANLILKQHRDIMRAIQRRQPEAARRAMHRHLDHVRELVTAADEGKTITAIRDA